MRQQENFCVPLLKEQFLHADVSNILRLSNCVLTIDSATTTTTDSDAKITSTRTTQPVALCLCKKKGYAGPGRRLNKQSVNQNEAIHELYKQQDHFKVNAIEHEWRTTCT